MKEIDDFIVPWVKKTEAYNADHLDYAWKNPSTDRLMSNENFHPPSEKVIKAVMDIVCKGNLYPSGGLLLREKLAELVGLKPENVLIANGSTEVIDVITRVFIRPQDEAIIPAPTFPMYEVRVKLAGGKVVAVLPNKDLTWKIEKIIKQIGPLTRLIFITSPNNPIGSVFPEEDLRKILDSGIPTIVDEAYYELEYEPRSMVFLLEEYPNLIIVRSMSKAWGIAGFRIGYSLASTDITAYLYRMRMPCSIGTANMSAAVAALDDLEYFHSQNNETKTLRKTLEQNLNKIRRLHVYPSSGNFILLNSEELGIKAGEFITYFRNHGIQLRLIFIQSLGPGFFRVTIGNGDQNNRFVKTLQKFLSERYKNNIQTKVN